MTYSTLNNTRFLGSNKDKIEELKYLIQIVKDGIRRKKSNLKRNKVIPEGIKDYESTIDEDIIYIDSLKEEINSLRSNENVLANLIMESAIPKKQVNKLCATNSK